MFIGLYSFQQERRELFRFLVSKEDRKWTNFDLFILGIARMATNSWHEMASRKHF